MTPKYGASMTCIDINKYCYLMHITDSKGDGMSGVQTGKGKWVIRIDGKYARFIIISSAALLLDMPDFILLWYIPIIIHQVTKLNFEDGKKEIKRFGKCDRNSL